MEVLAENIVEVFIPDAIPQSQRRGSRFLTSLRRRSKHLKKRILERGECKSTDRDREERVATEWTIAHIIFLEESLPPDSAQINTIGKVEFETTPRTIPNSLPLSGELGTKRLMTLRRHAEFLRGRFTRCEQHDPRGGDKLDKREILTIENIISHTLSLEKYIAKKNNFYAK